MYAKAHMYIYTTDYIYTYIMMTMMMMFLNNIYKLILFVLKYI